MNLLTRFNFPSKRWYDRMGQLSGGELRRIQLLKVLALRPNVLILDEPSNDLDLATLTSLEEYLNEVFEGCLVIVSHDNYFVNHVCDHLFVFEGDGIVRDFQGSYTEYLEYRRDVANEKKEAALLLKKSQTKDNLEAKVIEKVNIETVIPKKSTMSYNDRKEFNKLEKEMEKLNQQIKNIETKIASSDTNIGYSILADWTKEMNNLKTTLSNKEERWCELAALENE